MLLENVLSGSRVAVAVGDGVGGGGGGVVGGVVDGGGEDGTMWGWGVVVVVAYLQAH